MSTVSEAQVKVACDAFFEQLIKKSRGDVGYYSDAIRAALTAAAQVTVPPSVRARDELGPPLPQIMANRRAQLEAMREAPAPLGRADDAIREECAQLAEAAIDRWKTKLPDDRPDCYEAAEFIASVIRVSKLRNAASIFTAPSPPAPSGEGNETDWNDIGAICRRLGIERDILDQQFANRLPIKRNWWKEAADRITTLTQALAEAREVIEPFALIGIDVLKEHPGWANHVFAGQWCGYQISYVQFEAAAAWALKAQRARAWLERTTP